MFSVYPLPNHALQANDARALQRCAVAPASPVALTELLHLMDADAAAAPADPSFLVPVWRVRAGAVLAREGAPCEHLQLVRSGSFKCHKTLEDGYEQVLSLAGPGTVLGFEAVCSGRHPNSVVALEDSTVCALPLRELDDWRRQCTAIDHALQHALSRQLGRAGEFAEMMAAVAAEVRLARFLVWLSASMAERGQSPRRLYLRMSRRDIASLLGVAHETVSRSFTALAEWGCLQVDNRQVEILDLEALRSCSRSTRGTADDTTHTRGAQPSRHRAAPRLVAALA
jgi:CRP/FNR family transcriptional regulator, anaerobic regulatory protein